MCRLFPCIPIFRWGRGGGGLIKKCKKMCLCGGVKNRIVTCEKSMFGEKKDMSKLGRWVPNLPG